MEVGHDLLSVGVARDDTNPAEVEQPPDEPLLGGDVVHVLQWDLARAAGEDSSGEHDPAIREQQEFGPPAHYPDHDPQDRAHRDRGRDEQRWSESDASHERRDDEPDEPTAARLDESPPVGMEDVLEALVRHEQRRDAPLHARALIPQTGRRMTPRHSGPPYS